MSVKLTIPDAVVNGYHECSFAVSVGERYIVRKKRGDQGSALKVIDEKGRGQIEHWQHELVSELWPLTDKVEVEV